MRFGARWVWSFVAVVAMALCVGGPLRADDILPSARICTSATGEHQCPGDHVCDTALNKCVPQVVPTAGMKVCSDGLTTCPLDRECNMEAQDSFRCLVPGSTRCQLPGPAPLPGERAAGNLLWCAPGKVCDVARGMCSDPVPVPEGHRLCPDGLSTCPMDRDCNMEGEGTYRCLAPGAMRCELPRPAPAPGERAAGNLFWCEGGKVCDIERAMCVDKAVAGPEEKLCEDGLTICPKDRTCNLEAEGDARCLAPDAVRCEMPGAGTPEPGTRAAGDVFWCDGGKVCNLDTKACVDRATAGPDEQVCEDGLTVCPKDRTCNLEGVGDYRCLAADAVRCDRPGTTTSTPIPGTRAAGDTFWCSGGKVCDLEQMTCVDRATAGPDEKVCEDGTTICPKDRDCNLEGTGDDRCLVPGSTRCDLPGPAPLPGERAAGNVLWCGPGKVCNAEAARCDNAPLAAGMVARIEGSWDMTCNEYTGNPIVSKGSFYLDVPRKRGLGYAVTGRMSGGAVGDIAMHGTIYTTSVLKDQVRFSPDEGTPHSFDLSGPWSMDGETFVVSGEINGNLAGGLMCKGTFTGRSN